MDCLAEKFGGFHRLEGTKSLDRLFGFGQSRGKRFKKKALEERNLALCSDVFKLKVLFDLSDENASVMVASQHNLSAKTVHDLYKKEWKKILEAETNGFMREEFTKLSTKERGDYLKIFPKDTAPPT